jgi:PTH1 family peptidyl-tRNA hydrolase
MSALRLIVGLANPGPQYADTRHNAGAWFVERLAQQLGTSLVADSKSFGLLTRCSVAGQDIRLLIPTTFMNRSGQAIGAVASFYKISPAEILVAHDELDLLPGQIRLKTGGGHGGHNGLRDTIACLGNQNGFHRLRIGIGHPGDKSQVSNFVLGKAPSAESALTDAAIDEALRHREALIQGDLARVMNQLNGFIAKP